MPVVHEHVPRIRFHFPGIHTKSKVNVCDIVVGLIVCASALSKLSERISHRPLCNWKINIRLFFRLASSFRTVFYYRTMQLVLHKWQSIDASVKLVLTSKSFWESSVFFGGKRKRFLEIQHFSFPLTYSLTWKIITNWSKALAWLTH